MFGARSAASLTRAVESISATFQPDQPFALIPLQVCASRTESHSTWLAAVYSNHHSLFQRSATEKVVSDSPAAFSFAHHLHARFGAFCRNKGAQICRIGSQIISMRLRPWIFTIFLDNLSDPGSAWCESAPPQSAYPLPSLRWNFLNRMREARLWAHQPIWPPARFSWSPGRKVLSLPNRRYLYSVVEYRFWAAASLPRFDRYSKAFCRQRFCHSLRSPDRRRCWIRGTRAHRLLKSILCTRTESGLCNLTGHKIAHSRMCEWGKETYSPSVKGLLQEQKFFFFFKKKRGKRKKMNYNKINKKNFDLANSSNIFFFLL